MLLSVPLQNYWNMAWPKTGSVRILSVSVCFSVNACRKCRTSWGTWRKRMKSSSRRGHCSLWTWRKWRELWGRQRVSWWNKWKKLSLQCHMVLFRDLSVWEQEAFGQKCNILLHLKEHTAHTILRMLYDLNDFCFCLLTN